MDDFFTSEEKKELFSLYRHLMLSAGDSISWQDCQKLKKHLIKAAQCNGLQHNNFGMNPVIRDLQTAVIVAEEIGMKGSCLIGIMLHEIVKAHILSIEEVNTEYGEDVASIIKGLVKTNELYAKSPAIESENFRNLLLSFAEDMRVILIMIADRVNVMRQIKDSGNEEDRNKVANEAAYLYAPLAHKLGLYKLKSELEDLSLKYTQRETYYYIKDKLNETKASRNKYIAAFIEPIQKKVAAAGLKFDIKGRTKSIHSIWNKIQKQKTPFEGIYDLFAIRIILDSEPEPAKEKQECWQVYSIVTDMYQPNPKRLRDWLSIPKSNGYESLHITVMGPEGKWVEVQIRTRRMDEIAERGLAAHWRYKGIKGETGLDEWLTSVREALENADNDSMKVMDQFKMDLYEDEVFVFTPKGDLFKLAKGATVLDFAFHIHSKLGCKCIGAKVNGKNAQLKQKLNSGDQVEIMTSNVFGFVTVSGGIKIHRRDCPNANQMRERFGYRIVKARWAGKSEGTQYPITLRVVGHDDIGIVTNITSIISKENGITLRSIGIDSHDGLFSGTLTIMVGDTGRLEALIKKLRTVKGVKQVSRN